jgi:hypothetical protein
MIQVVELLSLLFVLGAQLRVLLFDSHVPQVLRQAVDAVDGRAKNRRGQESRELEPTFMNAEAANAGT